MRDICKYVLRDEVIPASKLKFPDAFNPTISNNQVWVQLDRAATHCKIAVREYLNRIFSNWWIGEVSLNDPLGFFPWGYLKNTIFMTRPMDLEYPKEGIRTEMRNILPEVFQNKTDGF